jgi:hypothetical protein
MFALIRYAADQLAVALVKAFKRFVGSFKVNFELTVTAV